MSGIPVSNAAFVAFRDAVKRLDDAALDLLRFGSSGARVGAIRDALDGVEDAAAYLVDGAPSTASAMDTAGARFVTIDPAELERLGVGSVAVDSQGSTWRLDNSPAGWVSLDDSPAIGAVSHAELVSILGPIRVVIAVRPAH